MQETNSKINKYDYLIVGAGLFGSVFAQLRIETIFLNQFLKLIMLLRFITIPK